MSLHYGTVNGQGRVVIPIEVRHALGISPGDRVEFVLEEGAVHLVTPRMRAAALWAKNRGSEVETVTGDARTQRAADRERAATRWERVDAQVAESTRLSEGELADGVLAALGLRR